MQLHGPIRAVTSDPRREPAHAGRWLLLVVGLGCSLVRGPSAEAAAFINVLVPTLNLVPTPTDYENDYVEAVGPAGIILKVKSTSSAGMVLLVRSADASPQIALDDLLVRTLTPPGVGGVSLTSYTPLTPSNLTLWSTGVAQGPFMNVQMDVRIRSLSKYDDGVGGATTPFQNSLIFTVMEP